MRPSIRSRRIALVRAQWAGLLALFLVIAGGTAYAANTIGSSDVIDNSLASVDLKNNQVRSLDAQNESLTGQDIADQSGVDTCTHGTFRFGEICAVSDAAPRTWYASVNHCRDFELRLPTVGEAISLAKNYDYPTFTTGEFFWTQDILGADGGSLSDGLEVNKDGGITPASLDASHRTVCVTTPTN